MSSHVDLTPLSELRVQETLLIVWFCGYVFTYCSRCVSSHFGLTLLAELRVEETLLIVQAPRMIVVIFPFRKFCSHFHQRYPPFLENVLVKNKFIKQFY